ncbi:MAG: hypothetical protein SF029_12890 [bacterium]|nr:hypothetical protein [bacterium]
MNAMYPDMKGTPLPVDTMNELLDWSSKIRLPKLHLRPARLIQQATQWRRRSAIKAQQAGYRTLTAHDTWQ